MSKRNNKNIFKNTFRRHSNGVLYIIIFLLVALITAGAIVMSNMETKKELSFKCKLRSRIYFQTLATPRRLLQDSVNVKLCFSNTIKTELQLLYLG